MTESGSDLATRGLVEALTEPALVVAKSTGAIVDANEAAASLFSTSRQAMVGHGLVELNEVAGKSLADLVARCNQDAPAGEKFAIMGRETEARAAQIADGASPLVIVTFNGHSNGAKNLDQQVADLTAEARTNTADRDAFAATAERLRRAQAAARLGTWDWDPQAGTLVWDGVEAVHGREPGSFEGTFDAYLADMHPDDRERVLGAINDIRDNGGELNVEYRIVLADGNVRWVLGRGRAFQDDSGKVVRLAGTCQDISERKEAEEAIAFLARASGVLSSSLDYEMTLESLAAITVPYFCDWCAIYLKTPEGGIERVAVNHADPDLLSLLLEYHAKFPPTPSYAFGPGAAIESGEPRYVREQAQRPPDPRTPPAEQLVYLQRIGTRSIIVVPMIARDRTIGAISLIRGHSGRIYEESDVSVAMELGRRAGLAVDNALLYRQAQEVQEELRRSNDAKDEFLGILSHEIRTPTTTIYGSARLLRTRFEKLDDPTRIELVTNIEEEAERLSRMIENLLALARMDLGRQIPLEEVDIFDLLHNFVAEYGRRRPRRQLLVESPDLPLTTASPSYVEQIMRNLVENADKYSPIDKPIEIRTALQDDSIAISILDHGPGIAEDEFSRVFESFYRSDKTSSKAAGKGLGLTVVQRLVKAHGGNTWAKNRPEGGLEIGFSLPLKSLSDPAS